jgi:hypothetical protein
LRGYKKWACPHCEQTSNRYWNLQTHIKRRHDELGDPVRVEKEYVQDTSRTSYRYHQSGYTTNPSFHSKATTKAHSLDSDLLDPFLSTLRKYAEISDLMRKISPSQPITMDNMPLWLTLTLLSSSNFQKNNSNKIGELPTGYRVRICDNCLSGNCFEPVFWPLELETLIKTKHTCCETETDRLLTIQQDPKYTPNNIREAQEKLLFFLRQVVIFRIISQNQGDRQLRLSAIEFGGPQALLQHIGNKKLSDNKSWIEEEDYIDLGKISRSSDSSVEKQNHWAYQLIKEEGHRKIIKINENELSEFIGVCKATFGTFQIQMDARRRRYFVVWIVL